MTVWSRSGSNGECECGGEGSVERWGVQVKVEM